MDKKTSSSSRTNKEKITLAKILRRPLVRLVLLIIIIIAAVFIIRGVLANKEDENTTLVGYQKLVNVTDDKYTFVDLEGKVKTYEGYTSMDDFYFDVTCVSKVSDDTGVSEMALINKNNKEIVKYGEYDSFTQVVGGEFYKVEKEGKYGIIDYNGKTIIEPEYDYISVTTVQEATEVVFECQKDNMYSFINETGIKLLETDVALHSISYANKFNSDYDTIVYISLNDEKRYFDLVTGEELFKDIDDVNISYNILESNGKISFYDENSKLKSELDTSEDYSFDVRVYFREYVVVEQRNVASGNREYKYTVYDNKFKNILESENKIYPVQDIDGNVYFIINEDDGVKIINENKKEVKVEGYEFNGNNINNLQFLVLNPIGDTSTYEAYNFKGKQVLTGIVEYTQKGMGLIVQSYNDAGSLEKYMLLGDGVKIALNENDEVAANDYYLTIENSQDEVVSVIDRDGNVKIDKASGTKLFYVEDYIGIQSGDTVNIYDVNNGNQTFSYPMTNYLNRDETVNIIELTTGYYTFGGNTILEK